MSEPNGGKSTWISNVTAGLKVFTLTGASNSKYPYEDYCDERLIVCDDRYPHFAECASVLNVYRNIVPVYGETRYHKVYWPQNAVRSMIVLVNRKIDEVYTINMQICDAMKSRFVEIEVGRLY